MAAYEYTQQTRGTVRRRIGRLMFPDVSEFFYGTVTEGVSTSVVGSEAAKLLPDDALVGRILYESTQVALRAVTDNVQSTGRITVSPAFSGAPIAGTILEAWPQWLTVDTVNDAISLAIERIAPNVGIPVEQAATLDADDRVVTIPPATFNKLTGIRFVDLNEKIWDYMATADPWQDPYGGFAFTVRGSSAYLTQPIPSGISDVYIRGYRAPVLPDSDDDLLEVNPAYVTYMAAFTLDSGQSYGSAVDPEQHSTRATNWFNQAKDIEDRSKTAWLPHTIPLDI